MESLPKINVVNSSSPELIASPLNITIQQNVNEDDNSSSQEPMETIPVEQIDHINEKSQKRKYPDIPADKPFMESGACPPFIKPLKQDKNLFPILSTKEFTFHLITPYDWWLNDKVKVFSLQNYFLRPPPYDLRTEENDANFLPYQKKKAHHIAYQKFLQNKEPEAYIFFNSKYTSPFTFNSEYLIDHTRIKGKLRNYDPLKQSFLFLPNENPKSPIIVPQEYLILNDDTLLQEKIPQCITDPLAPIQPIAFQPLGDCEKSYYYALAKKGYSHNELLFIISHLISILTKRKTKKHKKTNQELRKKSTIDTPKPESFPPTEEKQKYNGNFKTIS